MKVADRFAQGVMPIAAPDHDLAAFLARWYGPQARQLDDATERWRFVDHPLAGGAPLRWVCRRDDRIIGHQGAVPVELAVAGAPVRAVWAVDLMVDPRWRLRGVGPALTAALLGRHAVVAGLGISEAAQKAFRRSGWRDLGEVPRWLRLLRPVPQTLAGPMLAALSRPAAPVMTAVDAVMGALVRLAGVKAEEVPAFDQRVDAVWCAVSPEHPVLARRDHTALAWRYDRGPSAGLYRRFLMTRGGRVLGWFVLRFGRDCRSGVDRALLVDFLAPRRWVGALTVLAIGLARRGGAQVLHVMAPERAGRFARLGFVRRPGHRLMVHAVPRAPAVLTNPAAWFVTFGDSDLDHLPVADE